MRQFWQILNCENFCDIFPNFDEIVGKNDKMFGGNICGDISV